MGGILVNAKVQSLYNDILSDYCIEDWADVEKYNIHFGLTEKVEILCARKYFDIYSKVEGFHRVYDITEK